MSRMPPFSPFLHNVWCKKNIYFCKLGFEKLRTNEAFNLKGCAKMTWHINVHMRVYIVSFIPYFRLLVFGHFSCVILFPFFPSCPSCLAKCKQRLRNIFVTSSPKVTKNQKRGWRKQKWHKIQIHYEGLNRSPTYAHYYTVLAETSLRKEKAFLYNEWP